MSASTPAATRLRAVSSDSGARAFSLIFAGGSMADPEIPPVASLLATLVVRRAAHELANDRNFTIFVILRFFGAQRILLTTRKTPCCDALFGNAPLGTRVVFSISEQRAEGRR